MAEEYKDQPQNDYYLAKVVSTNNTRYDNTRLGDRNLTAVSTDGTRYYSSLDAEIFFDEVFIDKIVRIAWSVQQSTMPIFGYNSYVFDDLAVGARQISGTFILNFTKSQYMYDMLRKINGTRRNELSTGNDYNSKTTLNWKTFFDKQHCASWDQSFSIKIGYGDYKRNNENTMQVLYGVQITGYQQEIGTDGQVLAEIYTFVAKDIRYEMTSSSLPPTDIEAENTQKVDKENDVEFKITSACLTACSAGSSRHDASYKVYEEPGLGRMTGTAAYYHISIAFQNTNANITRADIKLKTPFGTKAIGSDFELEIKQNELSIDLSSRYTKEITESLIQQRDSFGKQNRNSAKLYLLYDITVDFEKDNVQIASESYSNQRLIYVNNK